MIKFDVFFKPSFSSTFLGLILGLFLNAFTPNLMAGPTVIRDNRIQDLGRTPNVGRGYSIAANTFQSLCYGSVEYTKPSYDMKYRYVEIEKDWESSYSTSFKFSKSIDFFFLKNNVDFKTEVSGNNTYHYHHIFAKISVDSYYHSLNEGTSDMSETAKALLTRGDVVGFFDSCGSYYVKSLGRHSDFLGLLRYKTTSSKRDLNFELRLKNRLRGFFGGGSTTTIDADSSFSQEAKSKALSINIWAHGLGKDVLADLIPTDIDSFKNTIQGVIKTMQDASTGIVTSMEVSPWVENTQFQALLDLDEEGKSKRLSQDQNNIFKEKKNLEANSELIAEFDRIDRGQMDLYYKALNCRRVLDDQFISVKDEDGKPYYDPERTYFQDHTSRGLFSKMAKMTLLDQWLNPESVVEKFYEENLKFINGANPEDNDGQGNGAAYCVGRLHSEGLRNVHFRSIPECNSARRFPVILNTILDRYCMPEVGRILPEEEEKKQKKVK